MSEQKIDPVKLKAAAEHLEWVCQQYPNEEKVQGLYKALLPIIEDAKAGRVHAPLSERKQIPGNRAVSGEGEFREFLNPDVEGAYVAFGTEMTGGLSDLDMEILESIAALKSKMAKE